MSRFTPRLVVFAKAPQAGRVKTRLMTALGAQGAAELAHHMLTHTLQQALNADLGPVELCMSPPPGDAAWRGVALPGAITRTAQGEGDLGERMARAVQRVTVSLAQPVLLMGTDCPALTAQQLQHAAQQMVQHEGVLIPVADGGYILIGLHAPCPTLFANMAWSTPVVAAETLKRMRTAGLRVWSGPPLHDIDEPADLAHLPAGF